LAWRGLPYYVVGKDMPKNEVYVTSDLQDPRLWHNQITLASPHWINQPPQAGHSTLCARATAPIYCLLTTCTNALIIPGSLTLNDDVRALTPGQSAVIYQGDRVVGSGIVVG